MRSESTISPFLQKQQAYDLCQYVTQYVHQLAADKLTPLLKLRYNVLNYAIAEMGDAVQVRQVFVEMQKFLQQHRSIQKFINPLHQK
jgi:hypothetical protein